MHRQRGPPPQKIKMDAPRWEYFSSFTVNDSKENVQPPNILSVNISGKINSKWKGK